MTPDFRYRSGCLGRPSGPGNRSLFGHFITRTCAGPYSCLCSMFNRGTPLCRQVHRADSLGSLGLCCTLVRHCSPNLLKSCLQSPTLVCLLDAPMSMDLAALWIPDQHLRPRCFCYFDSLLELDRSPYSALGSLLRVYLWFHRSSSGASEFCGVSLLLPSILGAVNWLPDTHTGSCSSVCPGLASVDAWFCLSVCLWL